MFLHDNILLILFVAFVLFFVFTSFNISTFSRSLTTTLYLTFVFFGSFFKMPFKATRMIFEDRDRIIEAAYKDNDLNNDHIKELKKHLQNRMRVFLFLYRMGFFSYTESLISLTEWYKNKPFTVKIKLINHNKKKRSFENKYMSEIQKSVLTC